MSVSGFTPEAANTPSTSSGSGNPAMPVQKAPCLAAGSCATDKLAQTSTAELVHRLVNATPPSAEAGGEATVVSSSRGSPAASEESLGGGQVDAFGGGPLGQHTSASAGVTLTTGSKESDTAHALDSVTPPKAEERASPVLQTVQSLSQGAVQGKPRRLEKKWAN